MSKIFRMILTLTVIGFISGGILAVVFQISKPFIEKESQKKLEAAVLMVMPEAKSYQEKKINNILIYEGLDSDGNKVGMALEVRGPGYQGEIKMMVGLDIKGETLLGIKVLDSLETPGLGAKITEVLFESQFEGVSIMPTLDLVKGKKAAAPNEVVAITGATISSQAVVDMINQIRGSLKL